MSQSSDRAWMFVENPQGPQELHKALLTLARYVTGDPDLETDNPYQYILHFILDMQLRLNALKAAK